MADPVAARLAYRVVSLHAGLVRWIADAEHATTLPRPFRLPGDERAGGVTVGGSVAVSRDPDDAMVELVAARLEQPGGFDPEHLDPVRQRMTHRLGELAGWYVKEVGEPDLDRWEPLAVRLGDLIGDQVAANALATSLVGHAHLAAHLAMLRTGDSERVHKAARERWRRLAAWYIRVLDEQPEKGRVGPSGRPVVQSVEGEGERRFG